jgi:zinc-ribbon domain
MYCPRCGAQNDEGAQFCTNCGQTLGQALRTHEEPAPPPPVWTPPAHVHVTAGRWLSIGWELVKADLGNYLLISLVFFLLNGVPLIQGALIAGFHIYTLKKLMHRPADVADLFKGLLRPRNLWVTRAGLWPGLPITHTSLRPVFPRRRLARTVWRKEAVQFAAGGVKRALLLLRAIMDEWPAVIADHAVENAVRRELP